MILIYYRNNDGQIISHHPARDGRTLEQLQAAAEEYNSNGRTQKAYIQEIQEDSLEMYLWEYAQKQKRFTEETVQAARDAIREALDCIDCLEVAK